MVTMAGTEGDKLLNAIREYFESDNRVGREYMWNILTALRGPDDITHPGVNSGERQKDKLATTAVIRYHLLGPSFYYGDSEPDTEEKAARRRNMGGYGTHFTMHVGDAFAAMGLLWEQCNVNPWKKDADK